MPALGESVTEGTVTRWLKAEGDEVAVDEPLLEVSTDKVDTEIPSPVAGTLTKILVSEDDTVPVGADLAVIGGAGGGQQQAPAEQEAPQQEQAQQEPEQTAPAQAPTPQPAQAAQPAAASADSAPAQAQAPAPAQAPAQAAPAQAPAQAAPAQAAPAGGAEAADASAYVTPLVRKLAAENDVDLAALQGTGVGGAFASRTSSTQPRRRRRPSRPLRSQRQRRLRQRLRAPPPRARRLPPHPSAAPRRRCRDCARPSPSAWWSRCRSRPS